LFNILLINYNTIFHTFIQLQTLSSSHILISPCLYLETHFSPPTGVPVPKKPQVSSIHDNSSSKINQSRNKTLSGIFINHSHTFTAGTCPPNLGFTRVDVSPLRDHSDETAYFRMPAQLSLVACPLRKSKFQQRDDHILKAVILPSGSVHRICKPICVIC
jgi:hypothetical protein